MLSARLNSAGLNGASLTVACQHEAQIGTLPPSQQSDLTTHELQNIEGCQARAKENKEHTFCIV